LPGEGDEVALQAHRLGCLFQALIDLVQIAADAQQQPAGSDRRQVIIPQAAVRVEQVLNAIRFGKRFSSIESVKVNITRGGLVTADEVPR
jgi:hypothetical protein